MSNIVRKIKVERSFTTDPMSEVDAFKLEFTQEDLDAIKKCKDFIKTGNANCCVIWFDGELLVGDGNGGYQESDYRTDGIELKVFESGVYAYCQSKYAAESQYESELIEYSFLFDDDVAQ